MSFLQCINEYAGKHWTANKYRHNGQWCAMPKDIMFDGKPALQFGKEIVVLPGIMSINHNDQEHKNKPFNPNFTGYHYRNPNTPPPTAIIAPITTAVPIEPMTYRQKRFLYVLTKRNLNPSEFTKSEASALITELTGKE